ncbi:hypothetical protein [Ruegeria atlantica]|uniref:hypothetical protein n=1 Tax=Ruegeria atlantica TaxID=81569 RepID=UPI00147F7EFD|nr:hypothetical protein [Ruegeria atlantica]
MNDFAVGISYQDDFPNELIAELEIQLKRTGLTVEVRPREGTIFASLEWTVPTLIVAYLAKPYFEAFLSEAGKDHYISLKSGLLKLVSHLFGEQPENRERRRSLLFSLVTTDKSGQSIKCIFPEGASMEQYDLMIEKIHELLIEDLVTSEQSELSTILGSVAPTGGTQYIEYSIDDESWLVIDLHKEISAQAVRSSKKNETQ